MDEDVTLRLMDAGDDGLLVEVDEAGAECLLGLARALSDVPLIQSTIVGHSSLFVLVKSPDAMSEIRGLIDHVTRGVESHVGEPGRMVEISVDFDEEWAPDLHRLSEASTLTRTEVIRCLCEAELRVRYLGFLPGFAYIDGVPDILALPRVDEPRIGVPHGSFAIAGSMAGFYPQTSPGGWNLVGRTNLDLWDSHRDPPNALRPGDRIRVVDRSGKLAFEDRSRDLPVADADILAEVLQPGLMTRIVGPARYERYAHGIAAGGPFDKELSILANRTVGNPDDAALLECAAVGPGLRMSSNARVAALGGRVEPLVNGRGVDQHGFEVVKDDLVTFGRIRDGFRVVIAFDGGVYDPRPPFEPRPVRLSKGGPLRRQGAVVQARRLRSVVREGSLEIGAATGPHEVSENTLEFLFGSAWTVTRYLDRMGIVLDPPGSSPATPADLESCGMRFGSVQWHPGGRLVIMGPDHPVTGGYLQPITVLSNERWKLGQLAPGNSVRFRSQKTAKG